MEDERDHGAPTLPDELLSFIFRDLVSPGANNPSFLRPERTSAPLNLSWVNSQWRQVSFSTPELWTSIALPTARSRNGNPNPNPTNGDAELLNLYISRSGSSLPFSFALDYGGIRVEEPWAECGYDATMENHIAGMHRLTMILDTIRHRWRITVIRCRTLRAVTALLTSLVLGAPLLEYLLIAVSPPDVAQSHEFEGPESGIAHTLDLIRCPKLASVVLQCPQLRLNPFLPDDASLPNLTSLAINTSSSQMDAFTWLQCIPNLEELTIRFLDAPPFMLPHGWPITLERLGQVTLICLSGLDEEPTDPVSLLGLLRLPALRSFRLIMDGSLGSGQGWQSVVNLIRNSSPSRDHNLGPPLEELELLGTPMAASELLEILELSPKIKSLAIDDALTTDEVMHRLSAPIPSSSDTNTTVDSVRVPLCPELETLSLHACQASLPGLADMTASRCRRPAGEGPDTKDMDADNELRFRTLKVLELIHSYKSSPPISSFTVFEDCQRDGLKIVQIPRPLG